MGDREGFQQVTCSSDYFRDYFGHSLRSLARPVAWKPVETDGEAANAAMYIHLLTFRYRWLARPVQRANNW